MAFPLADISVPILERWAHAVGPDWNGFEVGSVLAVVLITAICGMVGALVVGNRMAFFSDAMAHCAFAGISLGILISLTAGFAAGSAELDWMVPLIMAAFGALVGVGIAFVGQNSNLASDTVIGVFFAGAVGFGAMVLQNFPERRVFDPERFFWGGPNLVRPQDLLILLVLLIATCLMFVWKYNQFVLASFNPTLARSRGIPVALNNYLFVLLLALIVNFSILAVGVLLINALLIVPAAAASNFSVSMRQMFRWTFVSSLVIGLVGLYVSWHFRMPTGSGVTKEFGISGTIVCVGVLFFVFTMLLRYGRQRFAHLG
jgi:zinc transport system permease protein